MLLTIIANVADILLLILIRIMPRNKDSSKSATKKMMDKTRCHLQVREKSKVIIAI